MTDKRDSEGKPQKAVRLKLNKETLRSLEPKDAEVKGGAAPHTWYPNCPGCSQRATTCTIG